MPTEREQRRRQYRPKDTKLLFVGESPPANGTFFYAGNSNLYRYTSAAFSRSHGRQFATPGEFLEFFRRSRCFLEDVSLEPLNHQPDASRLATIQACVPGFSERIRGMQPIAVIIVKQSITGVVMQAIQNVGLDVGGNLHCLPFPAMGH